MIVVATRGGKRHGELQENSNRLVVRPDPVARARRGVIEEVPRWAGKSVRLDGDGEEMNMDIMDVDMEKKVSSTIHRSRAAAAAAAGGGGGSNESDRVMTDRQTKTSGENLLLRSRSTTTTTTTATKKMEAAASSYAESPRVVIYERNGLRHGGFSLRLPGSYAVQQLAWSLDGNLLAVVAVAETKNTGDDDDDDDSYSYSSHPPDLDLHRQTDRPPREPPAAAVVQIWARRNWHWYLTWQKSWSSSSSSSTSTFTTSAAAADDDDDHHHHHHHHHHHVVHVSWDLERPNVLGLVCGDGRLIVLEVGLYPTVSPLGTTAVVDGRTVRLTALRHHRPPPPACSVAVRLPSAVRAVAWRGRPRSLAGNSLSGHSRTNLNPNPNPNNHTHTHTLIPTP